MVLSGTPDQIRCLQLRNTSKTDFSLEKWGETTLFLILWEPSATRASCTSPCTSQTGPSPLPTQRTSHAKFNLPSIFPQSHHYQVRSWQNVGSLHYEVCIWNSSLVGIVSQHVVIHTDHSRPWGLMHDEAQASDHIMHVPAIPGKTVLPLRDFRCQANQLTNQTSTSADYIWCTNWQQQQFFIAKVWDQQGNLAVL